MSNQQSGAWQTARPRHSHSASRTPQNRSGTGSPTPQNQPVQSPRLDGGRPQQSTNNVWRSSSATAQARTDAALQDEVHVPANRFNSAEVKSFLAREAGTAAPYKPEVAGGGRASGAWGSKASHMANNQPFLVQLAKQIAALEGGG